MKVWLAVAGEYSDYRVLHVFTREQDAREYMLGEDVEERELHEGPVMVATWHELRWDPAVPDRPGTGLAGANPNEWAEQKDYAPARPQHTWWPSGVLTVSGWDREAVRKVYGEQRARYLAEKAGI